MSRSLVRLEAAVGAVLVERSSRRLRLTDAGALLRSHALRILGDVEEAEAALGNLAASPRGTLRVSAPFAFAAAQLGPMLPSFMARHPQVRVVLDVDDRHVDATDALARGSLVHVLPDAAMPLVDAHARYPSHRGLSAKVRVFVDALVAHMASLGSPPGAPRSTAPASPRRAASPRRGRG
ncbi:LysR family transcriptional regulator [Sorangium sp. So ce1128]